MSNLDERYALSDIRNRRALNTSLYIDRYYIVLSPDTGPDPVVLERLQRWGFHELIAGESLNVEKDQGDDDGFCVDTDNPEESRLCDAFTNFFGLLDYTEALFDTIKRGGKLNHGELRREIEDAYSFMANYRAEMLRYPEFEYPVDEAVVRQSVETLILTLAIVPQLKLDEERSIEIGIAALLHNVGWLRVPFALRGSVDGIKAHTIEGFRYLRDQGLSDQVTRCALEHHEHIDGSGLPRAVDGTKIAPYSKVIALSSACSSVLGGGKLTELPDDDAVFHELYDPNSKIFNPAIRRAMFSVLDRYPMGSLVQLSNGAVAAVTKPNPDYPKQPVVRVLYDTAGEKPTEPTIVRVSPEGIHVLRQLQSKDQA